MAATMGFGANIGNTLENTYQWETGWGQPLITQQYINGMANNGIKSIRVPVAWNTYAVNGVVPSDKMARVHQVVQWIVSAGMVAVVNIHWDGGWINNENNVNRYTLTDDVRAKFRSYWEQIAAAFADVGNQLVFESMNEEGVFYVNGVNNGTPDYAPLNELNQMFVDTVRNASGPNQSRYLLIAGFGTDIAKTCVDAFQMPSDPAGEGKLFLSLHYYTPFNFCGLEQVASWGTPTTTWGTAAETAELQRNFDKLAAFCAARHTVAIIGEFTVTKGSGAYIRDPASRVLWWESVIKAAQSRAMVPMLWDTGDEISRVDGSYIDQFPTVKADLSL